MTHRELMLQYQGSIPGPGQTNFASLQIGGNVLPDVPEYPEDVWWTNSKNIFLHRTFCCELLASCNQRGRCRIWRRTIWDHLQNPTRQVFVQEDRKTESQNLSSEFSTFRTCFSGKYAETFPIEFFTSFHMVQTRKLKTQFQAQKKIQFSEIIFWAETQDLDRSRRDDSDKVLTS